MHGMSSFAGRLAAAIALTCLATSAMAWNIQIVSPANGTQVTPGDTIQVTVTVTGAVAGISQILVSPEGDLDTQFDFAASPPTNSDTVQADYVIPDGTNGQELTITARADGYADDRITASCTVIIHKAVTDTTPPNYTGQAGVGIKSATWQNGNTVVLLEWYQAQDDQTASANIIYELYGASSASAVFQSQQSWGGPFKTVTGATSTTVTGLSPLYPLFFGVRAKDAANNRELNTHVIELAVAPSAVSPHAWCLYE